jgi:hypothetical protein
VLSLHVRFGKRTGSPEMQQSARSVISRIAIASRERSAPDSMGSFHEHGSESVRQERAMASLTAGTDASLDEIRGLYSAELARLRHGATVHTYLQILTTSKVRSILRRAGRIRDSDAWLAD